MDAGARQSKIAALALMALGVAFYLLFAVGETAAGELSGIQHFLPAAVLAALMYAGWRRPLTTGRALLAFAALVGAAAVAIPVAGGLPPATGRLLVLALPSALTGLLLVRAGRNA